MRVLVPICFHSADDEKQIELCSSTKILTLVNWENQHLELLYFNHLRERLSTRCLAFLFVMFIAYSVCHFNNGQGLGQGGGGQSRDANSHTCMIKDTALTYNTIDTKKNLPISYLIN